MDNYIFINFLIFPYCVYTKNCGCFIFNFFLYIKCDLSNPYLFGEGGGRKSFAAKRRKDRDIAVRISGSLDAGVGGEKLVIHI